MLFRNELPRQCVPQGHLLRGAHWLAMTGFFDSLKPGAGAPGFAAVQGEGGFSVRDPIWKRRDPSSPAAPQQERE